MHVCNNVALSLLLSLQLCLSFRFKHRTQRRLSHMLFILYKLRSYIHLLEIVEQCFKYSFASMFLVSNVLLKIREIYCVFVSPPSSRRMCPPTLRLPDHSKPNISQTRFFFHPGWPLLWAKTIPNHTYHSISHTCRIHFQIDIGLILLFFAKRSPRISGFGS